MKSRRALTALVPLIGVPVLLFLLSRLVDLRAVMGLLAHSRPELLFLAVALTLLAPVIVAVKLKIVLQMLPYPATWGRCWSAVLAAVTLNAIVPGRGGDIVRAAFLAEGEGTLGLLIGAVVLERIVDVFTLGLLALLASIGGNAGAVPLIAAAVCAVAVSAVVILALGHKLPVKAELGERVGRAARRMLAQPGQMAALLAVSALSWVDNVLIMFACLWAVGAALPLLEVARATPIAILAGILPVSVSGIGTRDTAMLLLLGDHAGHEAIVAGAFAYTALTSWFLAAFGMAALGRETVRRVQRRAEAARAGNAA